MKKPRRKVTPELIKEMILLYNELGTYKAVAERVGFSATTVARYIKENGFTNFYNGSCLGYKGYSKPIIEISQESFLRYPTLTEEEKQTFIKEIAK